MSHLAPLSPRANLRTSLPPPLPSQTGATSDPSASSDGMLQVRSSSPAGGLSAVAGSDADGRDLFTIRAVSDSSATAGPYNFSLPSPAFPEVLVSSSDPGMAPPGQDPPAATPSDGPATASAYTAWSSAPEDPQATHSAEPSSHPTTDSKSRSTPEHTSEPIVGPSCLSPRSQRHSQKFERGGVAVAHSHSISAVSSTFYEDLPFLLPPTAFPSTLSPSKLQQAHHLPPLVPSTGRPCSPRSAPAADPWNQNPGPHPASSATAAAGARLAPESAAAETPLSQHPQQQPQPWGPMDHDRISDSRRSNSRFHADGSSKFKRTSHRTSGGGGNSGTLESRALVIQLDALALAHNGGPGGSPSSARPSTPPTSHLKLRSRLRKGSRSRGTTLPGAVEAEATPPAKCASIEDDDDDQQVEREEGSDGGGKEAGGRSADEARKVCGY